jgi:phenylacetate-CoA ligase
VPAHPAPARCLSKAEAGPFTGTVSAADKADSAEAFCSARLKTNGWMMPIEDLLYPLLGRYLAAPTWLKASAGRAYSWLPERVRLGDAYYEFRDVIAEHGEREAIQRLASERLEETLRWAIETVPAYQGFRSLLTRDRSPAELLAELPLVDKLEIRADLDRYVSAAMPASERLTTFTGGSSRVPLKFFLQRNVTRSREYAFIQNFQHRVGMDGKQLRLSLRGRTVPGADKPNARLWTYEPIKRQLILSSEHMRDGYMQRYAEPLQRHRPTYIEAFPSVLYPLARWLAANPLPEFTQNVRGIMLYSENVYGFQMDMFREVFQCPVLRHYGHSERVLMAGSMPDDDRYFFWPQYGHFELVDFEGRPVTRPGTLGRIVGTSFDNKVMPFVRYATGDLAILSEGEHPELPGYVACERIEGRLQEFVVGRDQQLVSVATIGAAHLPGFSFVDAVQYEQPRKGELIVKYAAPTPLSADVQRSLISVISNKTGCDVTVVKVEGFERTARGKLQMLVQHLDLSSHLGVPTIG